MKNILIILCLLICSCSKEEFIQPTKEAVFKRRFIGDDEPGCPCHTFYFDSNWVLIKDSIIL